MTLIILFYHKEKKEKEKHINRNFIRHITCDKVTMPTKSVAPFPDKLL